MKLSYSPRAVGDLAAIADYLTTRSPRGALAVEDSIRKTIDVVAAFPRAGRILEQRHHVRVMPLGRYPYLLFYTVQDNEVVILHIRHGRRQPINPERL